MQQVRVSSDIFHVLAQRAHIEGGHPQALHLGVRPAARVAVEGDFLHALCFFQHLLVHSDLVRVHLLQDVELKEAADPAQHHIDHARLVGALHIYYQVVGLADRLSLQVQLSDGLKLNFNCNKIEVDDVFILHQLHFIKSGEEKGLLSLDFRVIGVVINKKSIQGCHKGLKILLSPNFQ